MEFVNFIFSHFFIWLGFVIILYMIGKFHFNVYNRTLRHRSIMKHGYPPEHCDADGEFPEKNDDNEN